MRRETALGWAFYPIVGDMMEELVNRDGEWYVPKKNRGRKRKAPEAQAAGPCEVGGGEAT
ncbi:MAG: hypothetical protein H5T97_04085 [Firmicutes bacterium]|nr:hypothetical protein [Bacillota bacterium]